MGTGMPSREWFMDSQRQMRAAIKAALWRNRIARVRALYARAFLWLIRPALELAISRRIVLPGTVVIQTDDATEGGA